MSRILILALATGLFVTGCDAAAERITEEVAERAAEEAAGGNVEIDADDGNVRIETSEGTVELGGGDVPEGFPDQMPVPDYERVHTSMSQAGENASFVLGIVASGSFGDVVSEIESGLSDGGWEIMSRTSANDDTETMESFLVTGHGFGGGVLVVDTEDGVNVQYTLDASSE